MFKFNFYFKTSLALAAAFFVFSFSPNTAEAATLTLSPASGTHPQGQTFSVNVNLSTPATEAANAVSGRISFPQDVLDGVSVSKAGSIVNLWVREPSISNGEVVFEGLILNPGFQGNNGKLLSINFRGKKPGNASVDFSFGSVLANDGNGTNILRGFGNASYVISAPSTNPTTVQPVSLLPSVSAITHSNQDIWYSNNDPQFKWSLPAGTLGVNIFHDKNPFTDPGTVSEGLFSSFTYTDLEDGVWYFHIRLQSRSGWGEPVHYRFQIDTTPPENFDFYEETSENNLNGKAVFVLSATDSLSGISHYELNMDGEAVPMVLDGSVTRHEASGLSEGQHKISATVFDKAGNYVSKDIDFVVDSSLATRFTGLSYRLLALLFALFVFFALLLMLVGIASVYLIKKIHSIDIKVSRLNRAFIFGFSQRLHLQEKPQHHEESNAVKLYAKEILSTLKLQTHIYEQIKMLERAADRRHLTPVEKHILTKLRADLKETEALAEDQIKNFEEITSH